MANVNTKFIAGPSFGLTSVTGQALTWSVDMWSDDGTYKGYSDVYFNEQWKVLGSNGLAAVTPGATLANVDPAGNPISSTEVFKNFIKQNPAHVSKLNVRALRADLLPTSIEILTPNVFSGQWDRQIINVTADSNMYQNQGNIVTITTDFFLSRDSVVRFNGTFAEAANAPLSIDVTIDKYLSLEKALVENYQLLQTTAGAINAVQQEIATINTVAAEKLPVMTTQMQAVAAPNSGTTASASVQPAVTRGNNFWI